MSRREADPYLECHGSFAGPGPSRAALRAIDWSSTPLGDLREWPVDLVCAARTVLAAAGPMLLWWGEQFCQLHNDALLQALGESEACVGRPAKQCWPERWDVLGPLARQVYAEDGPIRRDALALPDGTRTPLHWSVTMAPLYDDARQVAGVLANVFDLTAREAATANLQIALESNRRIGTAVGILMAHRRIPDSAAFELLRVASQRAHRKLREIAEDVVLTGALPEDH